MAQHPITHVKAKAFGPFEDISIEVAPGLNVIVGDNATGKSQLLKLMYSCTKVLKNSEHLTKKDLNSGIAAKFQGTFRPNSLGRLTRRSRGKARAEIVIKFDQIGNPLEFGFSSHAQREVATRTVPNRALADEPVYLPPNEVLSLSAGFLGLYENYETDFDETWRDTVELLLRPALRGPRGRRAAEMLAPFSELLQGGTVSESGGRFYLHQPGIGNLEAPLLAEGHRKLASIIRLIANGSLLEGGYLFWDEPEANLNPASQRAVAHALVQLAESGAQVFVTTHSSFLMREIQMSASQIDTRYIALSRQVNVDEEVSAARVEVQSETDLDDLRWVAALRAEEDQASRYLAW